MEFLNTVLAVIIIYCTIFGPILFLLFLVGLAMSFQVTSRATAAFRALQKAIFSGESAAPASPRKHLHRA